MDKKKASKLKKTQVDPLKRVGTAGTISARAKESMAQPRNADGTFMPNIAPSWNQLDRYGHPIPMQPEPPKSPAGIKSPFNPMPMAPTQADVAHLNMIQGVIARMGFCSFAVKLFSILVFCAMLIAAPFYLNDMGGSVFGVTKMMIIMTWPFVGLAFFDAFYLRMERAYRDLFNSERAYYEQDDEMRSEHTKQWEHVLYIQLFPMNPKTLKDISYRSVMISTTQIWFYLGQWAVLMGMVWLLAS